MGIGILAIGILPISAVVIEKCTNKLGKSEPTILGVIISTSLFLTTIGTLIYVGIESCKSIMK